MSRRKQRASLMQNVFDNVSPYQESAPAGAPARLNLFTILPDPNQPRRLLPESLYEQLYSGDMLPLDVLRTWLGQAASATKAEREAIEELRQTAATIEYGDLIQPIMVRPISEEDNVPDGIGYLVVVGERRWWCHILLTAEKRLIRGEQEPTEIKATIIDTINGNLLALQLIENMARADLSVIEKARGLQILQEQLTAEHGKKAKWNEIEEMLGLNRTYRYRIMRVLNLTAEAQDFVMKHRLQEGVVRPVVEKLEEKPQMQMLALQQFVRWQENDEDISGRRLSAYIDQLLRPNKVSQPKESITDYASKFGRNVDNALKIVSKLNNQQVKELSTIVSQDESSLSALRELRDQLNEIIDSAK